LDDLGSQLVPPSFYETASGSSIFGSQASEKELTFAALQDDAPTGNEATGNAPTGRDGKETRTKWKTLRFFVDERAMEEAIEQMDEDRNTLEVRCHSSVLLPVLQLTCIRPGPAGIDELADSEHERKDASR